MNLHANCVIILELTGTEYSCFEVRVQLLITFVRVHCLIFYWKISLFITSLFRRTAIEISPTPNSMLQSSL
jgi:hypothetical protein